MVASARPEARRPQRRGLDTRRELLHAALVEFAAVGFEAASTRAIAARAGVKQGQLTYHYETKDALWRATIDQLFERFDQEFHEGAEPPIAAAARSATEEFEAVVRGLVRAVSRLPELNRVMVHATTARSPRLKWLVERHVRPRFDQLAPLWARVRAEGGTHLDADPLLVYYCLLGASSLLYVNAPEAVQLLGDDASQSSIDALADAHAETIVAMLLGPRRRDEGEPPSPSASPSVSDPTTPRKRNSHGTASTRR